MTVLLFVVLVFVIPVLVSRALAGRTGKVARLAIASGAVPTALLVWLLASNGKPGHDREAFIYGLGGVFLCFVASGVVTLAHAALCRRAG